MEYLVRDVYREHLNNTLTALQSGALRNSYFGWGGVNLNTDASGNPRAVDLTVTSDDQTNSLVVSCTEQLYADMAALVEEMTKAGVLLAAGGLDRNGTHMSAAGGKVSFTHVIGYAFMWTMLASFLLLGAAISMSLADRRAA